MNKKRDQYTHIASSSASFSPKKNTLVWQDKMDSSKGNMDSSLFLLLPNNITPNNASSWDLVSSIVKHLCIEKTWKLG